MSAELAQRSENFVANPSRRRLLRRSAALGVALLGTAGVVVGTADIFSTIHEGERLGRETEAKFPITSSEAELNTRASFDVGSIVVGLGTAGIGALAYMSVSRAETTTTSE